jgi:hypothetical protein
MKRIGRRPFLLSGLALAACVGRTEDSTFENVVPSPPREPPPPTPPTTGTFEPNRPPDACYDTIPKGPLKTLVGIPNNRPIPPRLLSFTTPEQASALRAGEPLLSKTTSDNGHRGYLFDVLARWTAKGDGIAAELGGSRFERGRFAWPFLAGTRVSPERYGDVILDIDLRPEALVIGFDANSKGLYRCFDQKGNIVPNESAMARPEQIGAFFFYASENTSYSSTGDRCVGESGLGLIYREFYVGNPSMIARYSTGTPEILAHLDDEIADLRAVAASLDCPAGAPGIDCGAVISRWRTSATYSRLDRVLASMAFGNPFGKAGFYPQDFQRLADDLQTLRFVPDPFVVTL